MHSSSILACASLSVVLLATACSSENDSPKDPYDPGYLPTGTYSLKVVAASCNVNRAFQSADRAALFRNAPGASAAANIPVPSRTDGADASMFGMLRQDVDLGARHLDLLLDPPDVETCGAIATTIDVTDLSPTRIAIAYRESEREACGVAACSVDYELELVEAACPRECRSNGATLSIGPGGSMAWQCECL